MPASDYNKTEVLALGDALDNLIEALTGDGVDIGDLDELIGTFTAGAKTVNEAKGVPAAFGAHLVGRVLDLQGDRQLAGAVADEQTDPV